MRVTLTHHRTKAEAKAAVDRSLTHLFTGIAVGPIEFTDQLNQWAGDRMLFSLNAKMGPIKAPIKGSVDVSDTEVAVEVDLGVFGKFISDQIVKKQVEGRLQGLIA